MWDSTPTTRASSARNPGRPRRRLGLVPAPAPGAEGTWSAPSGTRVPRLVHKAKGAHLRRTEMIAKQRVPRDRRHGGSHVRPRTAGSTSTLLVVSPFHVKQPRWRLGGAKRRSRRDQRAQPQRGLSAPPPPSSPRRSRAQPPAEDTSPTGYRRRLTFHVKHPCERDARTESGKVRRTSRACHPRSATSAARMGSIVAPTGAYTAP